MEAPRIIPSRLEVKGAITSNNVAVPTISSTSTLTNKTLTTPVISGATISGGTSTGSTLTAPTINGAATIASGATITTPSLSFTQTGVTATGTSAADAAVLPTVTPALIVVTGATGSGVGLSPTGPVGLFYVFQNAFAGTMRFYCNGGTINGATGTSAVLVTTTGTRLGIAWCTTVSGAWSFVGNF